MGTTLVTGASGFVGTFLMEEMKRRNLPVIGVTRSAKPELLTIPTYGKAMEWGPLLKDVDTVVHLAARVHVMKDREQNPLQEFRQANVEATLHLARAAARHGVRRMVFVSTIKVNGEFTQPGHPFKAEDDPMPNGPYAQSKAEAEAGLLQIGRETGLEVVILRPPLVYGPGHKGNLATLADWAKFGFPSPFGAVQNRRSLVHVSNLCSAIIAACKHPNAANQVFLIADSSSVSTHDIFLASGWRKSSRLSDAIFQRTLLPLLKLKKSARERLLSDLEVDIEKAKFLLEWTPSPFMSEKA